MAASVYIETTVISYLTARPSKDLIQRAHQQLTRKWWQNYRREFDVYISPLVLEEAAAGDPLRARRRLGIVKGVPVLDPNLDVLRLARALINHGPIPKRLKLMHYISQLPQSTEWNIS